MSIYFSIISLMKGIKFYKHYILINKFLYTFVMLGIVIIKTSIEAQIEICLNKKFYVKFRINVSFICKRIYWTYIYIYIFFTLLSILLHICKYVCHVHHFGIWCNLYLCYSSVLDIKKKSRFAWFYHLMYRWAGQVVNIPGDSDLGLS